MSDVWAVSAVSRCVVRTGRGGAAVSGGGRRRTSGGPPSSGAPAAAHPEHDRRLPRPPGGLLGEWPHSGNVVSGTGGSRRQLRQCPPPKTQRDLISPPQTVGPCNF